MNEQKPTTVFQSGKPGPTIHHMRPLSAGTAAHPEARRLAMEAVERDLLTILGDLWKSGHHASTIRINIEVDTY